LGIESSTLWYSRVPEANSTRQHRWYGGTTQLADLKGSGELVIGSTSLTGTASQPLQVTGGAYVSGNLGIGRTNPSEELHVLGAAVISSDTATLGDNYSTLTIGERPAGDGYASLIFKNDTNAFSGKIDGTSAGIGIWGNKNSITSDRFVWNGSSTTEYVALRPRGQDVLRAQHDGTDGRVGINSTAPTATLDVNGTLNVSGIATATTYQAPGGTYASGTDTKTDAALVIDANSAIYTEHGGQFLRTLIENESAAINIGQTDTNLITSVNLYPGSGGTTNLYHGGANKKLQTTTNGIEVTGTTDTDQLNVSGVSTFQGNVYLGDDDRIIFGCW
jgi:hypothetical protein